MKAGWLGGWLVASLLATAIGSPSSPPLPPRPLSLPAPVRLPDCYYVNPYKDIPSSVSGNNVGRRNRTGVGQNCPSGLTFFSGVNGMGKFCSESASIFLIKNMIVII
jgi:hypothetical protein